MKVALESTGQFVHVNGVRARVWEGTTEGGVACFAYVTHIACHVDADASEFERDLQETRTPAPGLTIAARMIL